MQTALLDRKLYVPLYHQLNEIILNEIRTGKLQPGERLPAEDQIALHYGVSVITVRRTLTDLAAAGYLKRERGRGTFISRPSVEQGPRELTSFTQEMKKRGLKPGGRVLVMKAMQADSIVAAHLRIQEGAELYLLERLRLADGEPMAIQCVHIPAALAPGLLEENWADASLYQILEKKFGLMPVRAREVHSATQITGKDALHLKMPDGAAGISSKRLTFLADGRPFEFVETILRGDRYAIVLDLVAKETGAAPTSRHS